MIKKIFLLIIFFLIQFFLLSFSKNNIYAITLKCDIPIICPTDINLIACPAECSKFQKIDSRFEFGGLCVCHDSKITEWKPIIDSIKKNLSSNSLTNPALISTVGSGNMGESILAKILIAIIRIFFIIGSIAVLIYFLLGGLAWITSGGEKAGLENAKTKFTAGFIGIVIIASLYAITKILADIVGIEFFRTFKIEWPTIQ